MIKYAFCAVLAAAAVLAGEASGATPESAALYAQAKDRAAANYKQARATCDAIGGNPKDVCIAEAKAVRVHAEEEARALHQDTLKAYTRARGKIAEANFDLHQTRCAALTGNDKDVCQQQAKATRVAALADAKADKKVIEARADARDDKRTAEYKVALEKCDAFAGAVKDNCVAAAKTQYGK